MAYPPLVATDPSDTQTYPVSFQIAHEQGIPHRAVHIEIANSEGEYFVWKRTDGRLEMLGGHVDWLEDQNHPESYEEAALRETIEELNLLENWGVNTSTACALLREQMSAIMRLVNQIPSSHGNNNEWVTVYHLRWKNSWGDPVDPQWKHSEEGQLPRWLSLEEIKQCSIEEPMSINAALRLFLRRHDILVPLVKHGFA